MSINLSFKSGIFYKTHILLLMGVSDEDDIAYYLSADCTRSGPVNDNGNFLIRT